MHRRLAAILAADVAGYSRLMGEDEAGTLGALKAHRKEVLEPRIAAHEGRVVKLMGDGLLADFPSAVEAVRCAVEIQRAMAERNADVPEARQIRFRIGVNLGDVISDGEDIYGDGINVAARLEQLAEPGGICLSSTVHVQVQKKVGVAFQDLGEMEVKNIVYPVHVYRVLLEAEPPPPARPKSRPWVLAAQLFGALLVVMILLAGGFVGWLMLHGPDTEPAPVEPVALPQSDRPSIAVLPFTDRSADPGQAYFADGITEDLITDLAKFPGLRVTARTSTSAYEGRPVDVRDVGRELGVQYVLEGSVEKGSGSIRVTAQLIDAATGGHLWAERYDRDLVDLFAIRDDIRASIVGAITGHTGPLLKAEQQKASRRPLDRMKARDFYYRALSYFSEFDGEANARAREMLERSIELDPGDAAAHALLAWTHWRDDWLGWGDDPEASRDLALEAAEKAVALDGANYRGHWVLGAALRLRGDTEAAAVHYDRAFELNPHDPDLLADWAEFLLNTGRAQEAVAQLDRAMALNPHYPDWYVNVLTSSYYELGRYEEAVRTGSRLANPDFIMRTKLASSYGHLGREKEARAEVARILEIDPDYSISKVTAERTWSAEQLERFVEGLRKAGLPE